MLKTALVVFAAVAGLTTYASADEVVITRERPAAVVPVAPPVVVREDRSTDCATTTVRKENDLGDSKTVKKTDCR